MPFAPRANELGVDPDRIIIGGMSAGSGLAAATAQRLTDEGVRLLGQLLVYPMIDDRTSVRSDIGRRYHKVWTNGSNFEGWSAYLDMEPGSVNIPEYAAPARRDDLSGLPPAWIGVGTQDVFHDECVDYAQRLTQNGVACDLMIVEGAMHAFDGAAGAHESDPAVAFRQAQCDWIKALVSRNADTP